MSASEVTAVRDAVAAFVRKEVTLRELRRRAIPAAYHIIKSADPDAVELADDLILYFAEDGGLWTEEQLRQVLAPCIHRPRP